MELVNLMICELIEYFKNNFYSKFSSWQCQLRFYWLSKEDNLFLQQCNGKFQYGLKTIISTKHN